MAKKNEIIVRDVNIKTMTINGVDYISITDIAKQKNGIDPQWRGCKLDAQSQYH